MHYYWLALGVLSVWRVTHLLAKEDGPWGILARLRHGTGGRVGGRAGGQAGARAGAGAAGPAGGFWSGLLECFYCLSLWISAPFALWLGQSWKERALLWPAISALAILLERAFDREPAAPAAAYWEEEDTDHALLRRKE